VSVLPSKIVCVGRNYADHAKELGNAIPKRPVLFIKPPSSLIGLEEGIRWDPQLGECHFECEIALRIDRRLSKETDPETALKAIGALTLGLDLTLRDLQNELKQLGEPWERAKAFDGACVLADWVAVPEKVDWSDLQLRFLQNGVEKQHGSSQQMLFDIASLLVNISHSFSLNPGDVVMTGTPKGVAALQPNDQLRMLLITAGTQHQWQTFCHAQ
jgi:2-keto-4-pentenoate hydratase/2-oxohepta-3-ene-1,7-dioic acid hydratase in catechol pathway